MAKIGHITGLDLPFVRQTHRTPVLSSAINAESAVVRTPKIRKLDLDGFVADFSGVPADGGSIAFTNLSNVASNYPIHSYMWEKNDGSGWISFSGEPTAENPVESFDVGVWSVRVTIVGQTGSDRVTLVNYTTVADEGEGEGGDGPVVPEFVGSPTSGSSPLSVTFTNTSTGATSYRWFKSDGGDGGPIEFSTEFEPTESFNAGIWSVTLEATGPGGVEELTLSSYIESTI